MKKIILLIAAILLLVLVLIPFGGPTFQTPPFPLPASPMTAYRITGEEFDVRYFANDPNSIRGYAIVQQQPIVDAGLQQNVIDLLDSRLIYGGQGARCFEPGIAIHLGQGDSAIDVLICLDCNHVCFFRGDKVEYRTLNSLGIARVKNLYARLFPGHDADVPDEDTKRIADARAKEREKRAMEEVEPTSQPTR